MSQATLLIIVGAVICMFGLFRMSRTRYSGLDLSMFGFNIGSGSLDQSQQADGRAEKSSKEPVGKDWSGIVGLLTALVGFATALVGLFKTSP